jgi:hypothetical protein
MMIFYNNDEVNFTSLKCNGGIFNNIEMLEFETDYKLPLKAEVNFYNKVYTVYNSHKIYKKDRKEFKYFAFSRKYLINQYRFTQVKMFNKGYKISSLLKDLLNVPIKDNTNKILLFDEDIIIYPTTNLKAFLDVLFALHGLVLITNKNSLILDNLNYNTSLLDLNSYNELEIIENVIENNSYIFGNSNFNNFKTCYSINSKLADYSNAIYSNFRLSKNSVKTIENNLNYKNMLDEVQLILNCNFDENLLNLNRAININFNEVQGRFKIISFNLQIDRDNFDFDLNLSKIY